MDRTEAKAILSAYRADMPDIDEAVFAEALAMAEQDPELAQWFEDEQNFDEIFAGKLADVQPPADLKDKLLALDPDRKTIPFPEQPAPEPASSAPIPGQRPWWKRSSIISIAATVVILFGFGAILLDPSQVEAEPDLDQYYDRIGEHFARDPKLSANISDLDQIRHQLNSSGLRAPGMLPPKVDALAEVGFGTFEINGKLISFIEMKGDDTFCLYLLDKSLGKGRIPDNGIPVVFQRKDLSIMAWQGPENLCVLIVRAPVAEMDDLL
ncbi:MAG: hypothetical protein ACQKBW_12415 [Puniceicoccales bacterium]